MTDIVIVDDTDEEEATQPEETGDGAPPRFYLHDEMFPVEVVRRVTKNEDGTKNESTWEWVTPNYSPAEVAKFFFALSAYWLRWRYHPSRSDKFPDGYVVLDGKKLEEKRTPHGSRYYTLPDVERLAHALAENGVLDGERLVLIVQIIRKEAQLHGVDTFTSDGDELEQVEVALTEEDE
jgi:hypothetical protein